MSERYHLTEYGLVANFQQTCGCNAEGPGLRCQTGKALYKAMEKDSGLLFDEKISLSQADKSLEPWQGHLGA